VLLACVYYIVATPCYVLTNERVSWVRDRTEKAEDVRKRSTVILGGLHTVLHTVLQPI
jgi:hypothetical protein